MPVQYKLSQFKPFIFPMFAGKLLNFMHPQRSRELSNFKLQMVLGRRTRFMQNLRVNTVRLVKHPIDEGISSIVVLLKLSIRRPSIIHGFSGKFLNLEHVERSRAPWNLKPQAVLGRQTRSLQSCIFNEVRLGKRSIEEGNSFIAVPLKSSFFKPLTFPRFSGKLSKFEHPEKSRDSSDFKLQIMLGRQTRFLQSLIFNEVRLVKHSIDEGNSFIAVPLKYSPFKPLTFPRFSSKLPIFEHPERSRDSSDFKLQMVLGRQISFLQYIRSRRTSFLRNLMDG